MLSECESILSQIEANPLQSGIADIERLTILVMRANDQGSLALLLIRCLNNFFTRTFSRLNVQMSLKLLELSAFLQQNLDKEQAVIFRGARLINLAALCQLAGQTQKAVSALQFCSQYCQSQIAQLADLGILAVNNMAVVLWKTQKYGRINQSLTVAIRNLEHSLFVNFQRASLKHKLILTNLYLLHGKSLMRASEQSFQVRKEKAAKFIDSAKKIGKKYFRVHPFYEVLKLQNASMKSQQGFTVLPTLDMIFEVQQLMPRKPAEPSIKSKKVIKKSTMFIAESIKQSQPKARIFSDDQQCQEQAVRTFSMKKSLNQHNYIILAQQFENSIKILLKSQSNNLILEKRLANTHLQELLEILHFEDLLSLPALVLLKLSHHLSPFILSFVNIQIHQSLLETRLLQAPDGNLLTGQGKTCGMELKLSVNKLRRKQSMIVAQCLKSQFKFRIKVYQHHNNNSSGLSVQTLCWINRLYSLCQTYKSNLSELIHNLKKEVDSPPQQIPVNQALVNCQKEILQQVNRHLRLFEFERIGQFLVVYQSDYKTSSEQRYFGLNFFVDEQESMIRVLASSSAGLKRVLKIQLSSIFKLFMVQYKKCQSLREKNFFLQKFSECLIIPKLFSNNLQQYDQQKLLEEGYQLTQPNSVCHSSFMIDFQTYCSMTLLSTNYSLLGLAVDFYKLQDGLRRKIIPFQTQPPPIQVATRRKRNLQVTVWEQFYKRVLESFGFKAIQKQIERIYRQQGLDSVLFWNLDLVLSRKSTLNFIKERQLL